MKTGLAKTTKFTMEKTRGMQSSVEDSNFLKHLDELDKYFKFIQTLKLRKGEIIKLQAELMAKQRHLYNDLSYCKNPNKELCSTLNLIGEAHCKPSQQEQKYFEIHQNVYVKFLKAIIEQDYNHYLK
eukprot:UN03650